MSSFAEMQEIVKTALLAALRKVTPDMQTHKNPQLRTGPAPFKAAPAARGPPAKQLPQPGAGALDKPPVFARDGKKWLIVRIADIIAKLAPYRLF